MSKWCPKSQVAIIKGEDSALITTNRGSFMVIGIDATPEDFGRELTSHAVCVEEKCAAWRWVMISDSASGAVIDPDGSLNWLGSPPRGYCGLAGKP